MPAARTGTDWRRMRELAREKRDACANAVGEANARAREADRKLEMLLEYQRDYVERMSHAGAAGMAVERLQNFRRFLLHLERAVEQQRQVAGTCQADVKRATLTLAAAQRTMESFQVLVDRQSTAASVLERREQQKQQDEHASRLLPRFLTGSD
jgi:flagellar FliJ protein